MRYREASTMEIKPRAGQEEAKQYLEAAVILMGSKPNVIMMTMSYYPWCLALKVQ